MRLATLWTATLVALLAALPALAQPLGRPDGPPRPGGPGGPGGPGLDRVVDDLRLPEAKRDVVLAAVRAYDENTRRLTNLSASSAVLQLKPVLNSVEFTKLRTA